MPTGSSFSTRDSARRWPSWSTATRPAGRPASRSAGPCWGRPGSGRQASSTTTAGSTRPKRPETATRQPVLKVTLQPDVRPKGIAADLLLALGDPAWSSGTVQTLTNRAVRLLKHCGVELIVMDEFHHLFDMDRAKVMTKASQWLKVLVVNTGIPVVVCGMPEAEYVLSAEHTERRFKHRLTLRCFTWRTPQGRKEFCGMLKRLDESLPLADLSGLAEPELAGRFYLACRGVPDYLMTLVRGAVVDAIGQQSKRIELADLARVYRAESGPAAGFGRAVQSLHRGVGSGGPRSSAGGRPGAPLPASG